MGSRSVWLNSCTPNHLPSSLLHGPVNSPGRGLRSQRSETHRKKYAAARESQDLGLALHQGSHSRGLSLALTPPSFLTLLKSQLSEACPTCPTKNTTPTLNISFSFPLLSFSFIVSISLQQHFLLILFLLNMHQGTEYLLR